MRLNVIGAGFFAQAVIVVIATIISWFLIGYSLGVWFGAGVVARWEEVHIALQLLISFISASVMLPVGVVSFFAQLIADTPIF